MIRALALLAMVSCATPPAHETAPAPPSASAASSSLATSDFVDGDSIALAPSPKLAPLAGAELAPLAVPDYRDAMVSLPIGATDKRPIVLALHRNYDRPEWQCGVWREVTKGYAFVLCPRGVPRPDAPPPLDRWTYGKAADVRNEIDAALDALHASYRDYIAPGPIVYAGFSLGAILGVGIVAGNAERFPRAVLVEGGQSGWSEQRAKSYAAAGGKRILFACGQRSCRTEAKAPEKVLGRVGIETRSVFGGEVGHTYDGPVADEIARALPWLVEGDPRWTLP